MDLVLYPRATGKGKVYKQGIGTVCFVLLENFRAESSLKSAIHFQKERQDASIHSCSVKQNSWLRRKICLPSFSSKAFICFARG